MSGLIDTTEMYLKTIYELQEDGVAPLRARIVDRLGHSGPTVSQTVARLERDGYLHVGRDRLIQLTSQGREAALEVIRKHRLAEKLLLEVIGLPLANIHDEACRWEHVMGGEVEAHLIKLLDNPECDPFGNPIPGLGTNPNPDEVSATELVDTRGGGTAKRVTRIGEPLQSEATALGQLLDNQIVTGCLIDLAPSGEDVEITHEGATIVLPGALARHLFVI